jgi:hypothetical protein
MDAAEEREGAESWSAAPQDDAFNPLTTSKGRSVLRKAVVVAFTCVILYGSYAILADRVLKLAATRGGMVSGGSGTLDCSTPTVTVPQYFQTSPELWAGPTATGRAPFLAQTNPMSFAASETFSPSNPLETGMPIVGQTSNGTHFQSIYPPSLGVSRVTHLCFLSQKILTPRFTVDSIFQLMAHLSPYFSNPSGFGVAEYPLPPGANISQVQVGCQVQF